MQRFKITIQSGMLFVVTLSVALLIMLSVFFMPVSSFAKSLAPNFSLRVLNPGLSGYKNINLYALRGKVVLINFWATWCPPCRAEIPDLVSFYNKHKSKNFIIVGVNVNVTKIGVSSFIRRYKIDYPVVYATSAVMGMYGGINEIPQTFFISKDGILSFHWTGYLPKNILTIVSGHLMKAHVPGLSD